MQKNISIFGIDAGQTFEFNVATTDRVETKKVTVENDGKNALSVNGDEILSGDALEFDGKNGVIKISAPQGGQVRVTIEQDYTDGEGV
jgi:hypothetical protein